MHRRSGAFQFGAVLALLLVAAVASGGVTEAVVGAPDAALDCPPGDLVYTLHEGLSAATSSPDPLLGSPTPQLALLHLLAEQHPYLIATAFQTRTIGPDQAQLVLSSGSTTNAQAEFELRAAGWYASTFSACNSYLLRMKQLDV